MDKSGRMDMKPVNNSNEEISEENYAIKEEN